MKRATFYAATASGFDKRDGYLFTYKGRNYAVERTASGKAWQVTDVKSGFLASGMAYRRRDEAVKFTCEFIDKHCTKGFFSRKDYKEACKRLDDFIHGKGDKASDEGNKQGKKSSDKGANMGKKRNGFAFFKVDHTTPIENIKRQYRQLAMQNHPDMGGDVKTMQDINAEYDKLVKSHYNIHENRKGEVYTDERQTAPDDVTAMFADIIDGLIRVLKIDADDIEVCGKFLWLHNTTKFNKHHYKALGFRWSVNKKLWYRSPAGYRGTKHRAWSMDEIRGAYGSYKVDRDDNDKAQLPAA